MVARSLSQWLMILGLTLCLGAISQRALANCAQPVTYSASVEGNTVTICPENFGQRTCPDGGTMLREATSGGALARLSGACEESCYVDRCVPAGTYRYGFEKPYSCASSSCGTYYYEEATVSAQLPADCVANLADGPTASSFAGAKPWKTDAKICGYGSGSGSTGASCSSLQPSNDNWPVGLVALSQLLLAALGLFLLRRRNR